MAALRREVTYLSCVATETNGGVRRAHLCLLISLFPGYPLLLPERQLPFFLGRWAEMAGTGEERNA